MIDYSQRLREAALKATSGQQVESRARALNMIEALIEGMDADQIVEALMDDTLPVRYVAKADCLIAHNLKTQVR